MNDKTDLTTEERIVEDTVGATVGAATGIGTSALIGLAIPALVSVVPFGLIIGSVAGVAYKEYQQHKDKSTAVDDTKDP